jgi:hypothetical protein
MTQSLRKTLALLSVLRRDPREFYERTTQIIELRSDKLFRRSPNYPAVSWDTLIQDMEEHFGPVAHILNESALKDIGEKVRQSLKKIERTAPSTLIYNADYNLARYCYLVCRLLKPSIVLETGVAYGLTSAYILRALEENSHGMLYSVELPLPGQKADELVGIAIPEDLKGRWNLQYGFSKRLLPPLLREVGTVDIFVHDSCHTYRCMNQEFETVWPHIRSGGMLIADDVQGNSSFSELQERSLVFQRVVEEADKQALFGVTVVK